MGHLNGGPFAYKKDYYQVCTCFQFYNFDEIILCIAFMQKDVSLNLCNVCVHDNIIIRL